MTRVERVAAAYGLPLESVRTWSDRTLSVFERKAADLGLPGFTPPTPQPCEDDDDAEVLPF